MLPVRQHSIVPDAAHAGFGPRGVRHARMAALSIVSVAPHDRYFAMSPAHSAPAKNPFRSTGAAGAGVDLHR